MLRKKRKRTEIFWVTRDKYAHEVYDRKPIYNEKDKFWFAKDINVPIPALLRFKNKEILEMWCGLKITLPIGKKGICRVKKTVEFEVMK